MTLDEDAAKAVDDVLSQFPGAWVGGRQKIIFSIAMNAFGRRCAEAMREECAKQIPTTWLDPLLAGERRVLHNPPYYCPDIERLLQAIVKDIRRMKVK